MIKLSSKSKTWHDIKKW